MAQASGIRDLNDSREEALQALLGSLAPSTATGSQNGPKLSADQVKKISEKLQELLGGAGSADLGQTPNEKGELINEEGLPIVELNEPLHATPFASSEPTTIPNETDLIPLASLPASERERRRIERDRILGLLEQEESMQHVINEETEQTQRRETSQKRKEDVQSDTGRLKTAREMQKKMGKALLRNMAEAREKEEKAQKETLLQDRITEQKTTLKPKKSVSFADLPPGGGKSKTRNEFREKEVQFDWGDIAPAKLRSANRNALMTKTQMNMHPMKLDVVERLPTVRSEHEESIIQVQDSDDESVPSSPVSLDSDESDVIQSDRKISSLDTELAELGSDEDDPEDGLLSEDGEFDPDTAHHHREIALAYYEKRNDMGQRAAAAINTGEDEWNQPEVPLDATLSSSQPKPSVSRFKADRIASYNASPPSAFTSLGTSVLPASGSQTLRRAIRTGRLEDDKLVGGETGESASEPEDENVKEVLELLKQGQVHNIGPTFDSAANSSAPGPSQSLSSPHSALTHEPIGKIGRPAMSGAQATTGASTPTSKANPKMSKFKLNRTAGLHPVAGSTPPDSSRNTPISTAERSSPILPTASADEAENWSVASSPALLPNLAKSRSLNPSSTQSTTVVDSPSFPPLRQRPSSYTDITPNPSAVSERRLDRPPTVMSAAVLESSGDCIGTESRVEVKKISRFRAERM